MGMWAWQRRWNRSAIKVLSPLGVLFGLCLLVMGAPDAVRRGAVNEGVLWGGGLVLGGSAAIRRFMRAGFPRRRSDR